MRLKILVQANFNFFDKKKYEVRLPFNFPQNLFFNPFRTLAS